MMSSRKLVRKKTPRKTVATPYTAKARPRDAWSARAPTRAVMGGLRSTRSLSTPIEGSDYLGPVSTYPDNDEVTTINRIDGIGLVETRLADVLDRYEMWAVHSIRFTYNPVCDKTTDGAVVLAFDFDCKDTKASAYSSLMAMFHSKTGAVHEKLTLVVNNPRTEFGYLRGPLFWRPGQERLTCFGMLLSRIVGGELDTTYGHVTMDYRITAFIPEPFSVTYVESEGVIAKFGATDTRTFCTGDVATDTSGKNIQTFNTAGTSTTMKPEALYHATIQQNNVGGTCHFLNDDGEAIAAGNEIFFRQAHSFADDATGKTAPMLGDSSYVGEVVTKLQDFGMKVLSATVTAAGKILLTNIVRLAI